jgi:hypothetical protein
MVLQNHDDAWSVKHETTVKSYTGYEISNSLDCTDDDGAFEQNGSSNNNNSSNVIVVMKIFGDSMTSRNFIMHYHYAEQASVFLSFKCAQITVKPAKLATLVKSATCHTWPHFYGTSKLL